MPISEEITTHLLLVRKAYSIEVIEDGKPKREIKWHDWQLLELPAGDISPEKPIVIPSFEELQKRELSKDKQELLEDLVQRYDKIEAAAWKKAGTPTKPGDSKPWWRW